MDPRDTPGYRTHLALTNLRRIDRDQLEPADRALVETASRALVEGLDDNMNLVDGAYDHFAGAFQRALDGYVDCVANAGFDAQETSNRVQFLDERAASGTDYLREQFLKAADELRDRTDADSTA